MYRIILYGMGRTLCAGFLRNPSPFDAISYKQKKEITLKNEFLRDFFFLFVIRAGFKPATPTSVVWYSIQLS